jgi:hemerythrin superfamily protein
VQQSTSIVEDTHTGDVVDVLKHDHKEVSELVSRLEGSSDPSEKRSIANDVITKLVQHSVAEETFVYPLIADTVGHGTADRDANDHQKLEEIMAAMESTDTKDSNKFDEYVRELKQALEQHVSAEEGEQFPKLREKLPREQLQQLAAQVNGLKNIAPTHPHPLANQHNQAFHTLTGPVVGLADRVRDLVSGRIRDQS